MSYNGWKNHATWAINVWFNPESVEDVDTIQEQVEADYENLPDYMKDLCTANEVDWDELRSHFEDEEEEEED